MLEEVVGIAERAKASDIHLTPGKFAKYRVRGVLRENEKGRLFTEDNIWEIFNGLDLDVSKFQEEYGLDVGATISNSRIRVHFYKTLSGVSATLRLIPKEIPEFGDLNLPEVIQRFTKEKNGLVIVTGPTGSGKSTTLASLINTINKEEYKKIITVEDPIEYIYEDVKSSVEQRELGQHVGSFDGAIKQALREDPDVLLVGELRDLETIQSALRMAETGHLVFGTLHTRGAAESFDRIIDVFDGSQQGQIRTQLANVTKGVVSQQLVNSVNEGKAVPLVEVLVMNTAARGIVKGSGHMAQLKDTIQQSYRTLNSQTFVQSAGDLIIDGTLELSDVEHIFSEEDMKKLRAIIIGRR